MGATEHVASAPGAHGRLSVQEFFVDLLGSLVPGLLFTFLSFACIGWPSWSAIRELQKATPLSTEILRHITNFGLAFRWEIAIFFLVFAYVVGHFFFRCDPKEPDARSFARATKRFTDVEREAWAVREDDVQFPYRYLREYLEARNLGHLARLVPWKGSDPSTHHMRTKSFINLLKIRLFFYYPERCWLVTRNEAHIRLMSSIWYAARTLLTVCFIGVAIGGLAGALGYVNTGRVLPQVLVPMSFVLVVAGFALWAKWTIEKFIHYQRIREVVFVLETAHNAARERPSITEEIF